VNAKGSIPRDGRRTQINRPEYLALRDALQAALDSSGVGQRELSRKLNKPFVYMNRILQGRRTLEFAEFLDICEALGVDPIEVFTEAMQSAKKDPDLKSQQP